MKVIIRTTIAALALTTVTAALAQQPAPSTRIRGQIEAVDGNNVTIKSRTGETLKVKLSDDARVMALVKAKITDIKPSSYIGVTAMPEPDGSQKAIAIHIFMESQRGTNEGFRPWDLKPNSTMTNAAVDSMVKGVNGQELVVKYKNGEKKVEVTPQTAIVAYTDGEKSEVKPGAQIIINGATKQPDGSFVTSQINVGRGLTPPM